MKTRYKYIFAALLGLLGSQAVCPAQEDGASVNNIKLFKKTEKIAGQEDMYRITLDSYVTGKSILTKVTKPVDVVLVLDVSTSMMANKQEGDYLLNTFQPLTTGDHLEWLHLSTADTDKKIDDKTKYDDGHDYKVVWPEKDPGKMRYRIGLNGATTDQHNFAYFKNGTNYFSHLNDQGKKQYKTWDRPTGWYYSDDTSASTPKNWTPYKTADVDISSSDNTIFTDVKLDLLEKACRTFIGQIYDNQITDSETTNHNIGIITWGDDVAETFGLTEVTDGNRAALTRNVSFLTTKSGTRPLKALDAANKMLTDYYNTLPQAEKDNRSKVVVFFTDGEPNSAVGKVVHRALPLKQNGVRIFSVGVFTSDQTSAGAVNGVDNNIKIWQYMEWVSSYYPNADWNSKDTSGDTDDGRGNNVSNTSAGTRNTDGVNYYQYSDGTDLDTIFKSIAQTAGADTYELTKEDAAAIDVMSSDFEFPSDPNLLNTQISQWVCIAYENGQPNEDWTDDGVEYRRRGGYIFKEYPGASVTTDKYYDGDNPVLYNNPYNDPDADGKQRVVINGFWYSKDDDLNKDGNGNIVMEKGKPVVNIYGNWVGEHQDGKVAGKMLEFTFDVHLKASSMGGYSLPSNESTSGIYKNTSTDPSHPEYTQLLTAYSIPVVDVPSIIILKEGLKYGDSAIFTVETTKDANGKPISKDSPDYKLYTVVLTQEDLEGGDSYLVIKDLEAGYYKITEKTEWTWAYDNDEEHYASTQEYLLRAPAIEDGQDNIFKETVTTSQQSSTYGQTTDMTERVKDENSFYVLNDALHLLYKFGGDYNTPQILHDEAMTVNVFGAGGGNSEYGGEDPEEEAQGE